MKINDLRDKKIVIFGYGREGQATLAVLRLHGVNDIIVTDEKIIEMPEFVNIDKVEIDGRTVVIKAPGIPLSNLWITKWRSAGAVITSSTNIFMAERKGKGKIIGVTGTKGKSTTASLLAHVIDVSGKQVKLVGNIGLPSISEVGADDETIFVIEMSSYQLADLEIAPDIGVILNLYEEHMDWHVSVGEYQKAKMRIGETMTAGDVLVYNQRFPQLVELAGRCEGEARPIIEGGDEVLQSLKLLGDHNRENALAVLTVARLLNIDDETVKKAFASFEPLPHRLQFVGEARGVQFINDSISTTPESALAALEVYKDKPLTIILGGQDRGYNFDKLAQRLAEVDNVLALVMPGGDNVFAALSMNGVAAERVSTLAEAVDKALAHLVNGGVCLLSPASPSYGQFKNFEERGAMFVAAVSKLG